jgi:hypothetical protein
VRHVQYFDSKGIFISGTYHAYPQVLGWVVNIHGGFYLQTSNEVRVTDLGGVSIKRTLKTGEVVITISKTPHRNTGKLLKKIIAAAALSACSFAQAGVLNFEQEVDSPFFFSGDHVQVGEYWVESYGGTQTSDLAGAIIDGSDGGNCMGVSCPVNNTSHYYSGLDDGYFYFGLNNDANFKVKSLQASFIGAGQLSFPATSGILVLQGFNALGGTVGNAMQLGLAGPNVKGQFNFANYNLGAFGNNTLSYVRVLGYACDTSGSCLRNTNLANFGIDNIVTATVPEPTSIALLGLGVAGFAFARRRAA